MDSPRRRAETTMDAKGAVYMQAAAESMQETLSFGMAKELKVH